MAADFEESYRSLRPYAFAIAYRMLGSVSEAEDVVQDAFLRLATDGASQVRDLKAYLATITTRIAIDRLRSARVRRETYVGTWLPEPVLDDTPSPSSDVAGAAELADTLSMAFLVVLEQLNPIERAVFLLHDVFGYGYDEIATIVHKSEANCRQLTSRARKHVHDEQPRFTASRVERARLADRFLAACQHGDVQGLVGMLAQDAVLYGDGGSRGAGLSQPVYGRDRVVAMLGVWFRRMRELGVHAEPASVNGQPGARFLDPQGRLINVITFDVVDGAVQTVRSVINPDKLTHLGQLSPLGVRRQGHPSGGDWTEQA